MAKRTPRPSYEAVRDELKRLAKALERIEDDKADENGKLTDVQLAQVAAARTSLASARTALTCIQDQAPYNMTKRK